MATSSTSIASRGPPTARGSCCCTGSKGASTRTTCAASSARRIRHGLPADLIIFRSCGEEQNRLLRSYHSGETGDLGYVLSRLIADGAGAPDHPRRGLARRQRAPQVPRRAERIARAADQGRRRGLDSVRSRRRVPAPGAGILARLPVALPAHAAKEGAGEGGAVPGADPAGAGPGGAHALGVRRCGDRAGARLRERGGLLREVELDRIPAMRSGCRRCS